MEANPHLTTTKVDYKVYACNRPNAKDEDRHSKHSLRLNDTDMTITGVYDGHGGKQCSSYISTALPQAIIRNLEGAIGVISDELLIMSFTQVDMAITQPLHDHFSSIIRWPMPRKIRQKAVDAKLQEESTKEIVLRARSGSTALVAVIEPHFIHFANVGDCRAVLGRTNSVTGEIQAEPLTVDQDGDNPLERARMIKEHPGEEKDLFAGSRLFGQTPITRSFGDVFYKEPNTSYAEFVFGSSVLTVPGLLPFNQNMERFYPLIKSAPYLTAIPVVVKHTRSAFDRFLIMASDGVWAVKGVDSINDWVVSTAQIALERRLDPAKYIMEEIEKYHPGDDVTIQVIVFHDTPSQP